MRRDRSSSDDTGAPRASAPQTAGTTAAPSATAQASQRSGTAPGSAPAGTSSASASGDAKASGGAVALLPALSTPTGGGAIRGIGEKFEVAAATGTASLQIPLPISPGRGGHGPELSLSYSSGAGNGPFGLGFQLSVATISRKTDKGLPRYLDDAESDIYVLSGAEDLVPVLDAQGAPLVTQNGNYRITRYRPRTEGLFARIERWVSSSTPPPGVQRDVHWRVAMPDGSTRLFGLDPQSRIADPEHPDRIFSWLLEESRDDKGNVARYEYKAEDGAGVDPILLRERSRFDYPTSGAAPTFRATAARYLKRVRYCNATPDDASDCLLELVFDYGEHAPIPDPVVEAQPWPVRVDPFSTQRAGFEVRTYRLCQRVLMFHRFSAARTPLFVRATEFTYDATAAFTYLTRVTQAGYLFNSVSGGWQRQEVPRLDLDYQRPQIHDQLQILPEASREGLAGGVNGARKQWVDLDGEGIPGVLIEQRGSWFYKQNNGQGLLSAPRQLPTQPSPDAVTGGLQQLEDIDGDGRLELAAYHAQLSGYFTRTTDGDFEPLRAFQSIPHVDWNDPNLRAIDLDGDGLADLLITENDAFVWYRSRGRAGFEASQRVSVPFDEQQGPRVVFANSEQSIQLADMSGDGLVDIVRIRNGEVCYWPNQGYGRFGRKVTLENSPLFTTPDAFHASRVRFFDFDGSGTSDLLYHGPQGTTLYFNQAGNRLAPGVELRSLPPVDSVTQLSAVDLLGTGTGCLVWSSPLGLPAQTVAYVDVLGSQKPHLLRSIVNNLGATTTLSYAASTQFYLDDKRQGIPWLTRLPFPVQVVASVRTEDAVSGGVLTRRYRYRHGFFDGVEREFRGFARVEQLDAEDFPRPGQSPLQYQSPVRSVSFYHTGAWLEKERLELGLAREYFQGGPPTLLLRDTVLPRGLSTQDEREATRALRGSLLRTEVYADDGTLLAPLPYLITEQNQEVRLLQPSRGENKYGVFFAHAREQLTISSERNLSDARVAHSFTLDVDQYGAVTRQAALVYGRATGYAEQQRAYATLTESDVIHQDNPSGVWRLGTRIEQRSYELSGLRTQPAGALLLPIDDLRTALASATDIPYEAAPSSGVQRRLIEQTQQTFYTDDAQSEAPLGSVGLRALPYQSYQLALTPGLVQQLVNDSVSLTATAFNPTTLTSEGGYALRSGAHFIQSGRVEFDPAQFYLPRRAFDAFGNPPASVSWDSYALLPVSTTDSVANTTTVVNDYRVLQPSLVTSPNLNQTAVAFDALGLLIATAVTGKAGAGAGDTLADPTTRLTYDLLAFQEQRGPASVHTFAREAHGPSNPRFQESYAYSDGFGRIALQKVQAEAGDAPLRDATGALQRNPNGTLVTGFVASRWVGTGRTLYNNKGKPIKQYEPFFSSTPAFESEDDLVQWGVTPILRYDSLDRLIQTDLPDGTFSRVEFDAWQQRSYDSNDTVLQSQWYAQRGSPDPAGPVPTAADARAAWLAAQHANTPTTAHLDSLGRVFLSVAHNRTAGIDALYETRTRLDIEGNALAVYDARQIALNIANPLPTLQQTFDVAGRRLRIDSADAGTRVMLQDAAGKLLRSYDARGSTTRSVYDAAQRPTHQYVAKAGTETLVTRISYGEALDPSGPSTNPAAPSPAQALNLRGRAHLVFDSAGLARTDALDFKGNVLSASRRLATAYQTTPDWSALIGITAPALLEATAALEGETFTTQTQYDALNRVTQNTAPDGSITTPTYNEANLLERVQVAVNGTGSAQVVISNVEYNARGQRLRCEHAATTGSPAHVITYTYDPATFRVTQIRTTRPSDGALLQLLDYTYDPVGNITQVTDGANWDPVLAGLAANGISGDGLYTYDALYRLLSATGREHPALQTDDSEPPLGSIPHGNNLQQLRNYTEELSYDEVGNISQMRHLTGPSNSQSWSRRYRYAPDSNRLLATSLPGDAPGTFSALYGYAVIPSAQGGTNDAGLHGSMVTMPHLAELAWDYADRLQFTSKSSGSNQFTYFTYDASGQRVRKVYEHNGIVEERIYLGGYEVYRRRAGSVSAPIHLERQTLHVTDDARRVAMVETKTVDTIAADATPTGQARWRYQLDNHLGSSALELDQAANVISYEEYHPYGSTAFHTASGAVSQKRYRYTGKEKDDETGLYYHGARYYAAWLGRWTAADPAGMVDGLNLYRYSRGNPMRFSDPGGTQSHEPTVEFNGTFDDRGNAKFSLVISVAGPGGEGGYTLGAAGGLEELARVGDQLATGEGLGAELSEQQRQDLFLGIATFDRAARDATPTPSAEGEHAGLAADRGGGDGLGSPGRNAAGPGALTTYESTVRAKYLEAAKDASKKAVGEIDEILEAVKTGTASEAEGVAQVDTIARGVSKNRDAIRTASQKKLGLGGRLLSEAIEQPKSFETRLAEKSIPGRSQGSALREVAISAGKSNRVVTGFAKAGKVLGPVGVGLGVGLGVAAVVQAPPEEKVDVAVEETAAFGGGAIGASLGTAAAVAATGLLVTAGIIAAPAALTVIAIGLLGGAVGGYFGAEFARGGTRWLQGR